MVGDLLSDVVVAPEGPLRPGTHTASTITSSGGGSAAITAAWLAGTGHSVSLLAAVGEDPLGTSVREDLAVHGVEHLGPVLPDAATGCCVVLLDAAGDRTLFTDRGASEGLTAEHVGLLLDDVGLAMGQVAWVHLSGDTLRSRGSRPAGQEVARRARDAGVGLSVDVACVGPVSDLGPEELLALVAGADVLLADTDELDALGGETAVLGAVRGLVTRRGVDGATWSDGHEQVEVVAVPGPVVDTTGAGAAFAAGFVGSWVDGARVADALASGAARAAEAVAQPGARPPTDRP